MRSTLSQKNVRKLLPRNLRILKSASGQKRNKVNLQVLNKNFKVCANVVVYCVKFI